MGPIRDCGMTLRLPCVRCGALDEMDPCALRFGVCRRCCEKWYTWRARGLSFWKRHAMWKRHYRNMETHPTTKALRAAIEALEAVEPGTLAEVDYV